MNRYVLVPTPSRRSQYDKPDKGSGTQLYEIEDTERPLNVKTNRSIAFGMLLEPGQRIVNALNQDTNH